MAISIKKTETSLKKEFLEVTLRRNKVKIIISDERMPGMSGADLLGIVKEDYPEVVRMMLTGHASVQAAMKAVNNGEIYRFFNKPWDNTELLLSTKNAMDKFNIEEENRKLLAKIRNYENSLKMLEKNYPGITKVEKDEDGGFVLSMSHEEYESLMDQYKAR